MRPLTAKFNNLALPMIVLAVLGNAAAALPAEGPADPVAGTPPPVNQSPGPEYADSVRMFQGIPGIERAANGRLWATWYGGGQGEDRYNYILLATSRDDGRSWSQPKLILDPDGDGPVRAFDPCLWHDPQGRLWLSWAQRGSSTPELFVMHTDQSGEENPQWSPPHWICNGIMMNKPTVWADGRWLLPVAMWKTDGSARVVASNDRGNTWSLIGAANVPRPQDRNCDEPMIVERRDGSLWMLLRTGYGIGESISTDGGKNWSPVAPSSISHAVSRFFVRRLHSGKLLLVKHSPPGDAKTRSHLTAYLSDDDGKTWTGGLLLDERSGVSYPDGVEDPQGTIYVIYDYDRKGQKEILLSIFTETDVAGGKFVSDRGRQRVLVNRATGVNPGKAPRPASRSGKTP